MLTGRQCAAGRVLARLSQAELAKKAGIFPRTLVDFENDRRAPKGETKLALANALRASGIEFITPEGVCRA